MRNKKSMTWLENKVTEQWKGFLRHCDRNNMDKISICSNQSLPGSSVSITSSTLNWGLSDWQLGYENSLTRYVAFPAAPNYKCDELRRLKAGRCSVGPRFPSTEGPNGHCTLRQTILFHSICSSKKESPLSVFLLTFLISSTHSMIRNVVFLE